MPRQVKLYIAMSLDGLIADEAETLAWLENIETHDTTGYQTFYDSIDTVVLGRRTFDWVIAKTGQEPYSDKKNYILTTQKRANTASQTFVNQRTDQLIHHLSTEPGSDIWVVGGSQVIQPLIKANLIDQYRIFIAPVILGTGIPLFSQPTLQHLHLDQVKKDGQLVELQYSKIDKNDKQCQNWL